MSLPDVVHKWRWHYHGRGGERWIVCWDRPLESTASFAGFAYSWRQVTCEACLKRAPSYVRRARAKS